MGAATLPQTAMGNFDKQILLLGGVSMLSVWGILLAFLVTYAEASLRR